MTDEIKDPVEGHEEEMADTVEAPQPEEEKESKKEGVNKLEEQVEELQLKVEETKDKYIRLYADFDNYKKRAAKEKLELIKEAGKDILLNLLPVLDDFERARKNMEQADSIEAVKEGMDLIFNKLKSNLELKGLKRMEVMGEPFDAELHEAITEIPAPADDQKGKVVDVVEEGYTLNDKIIRYAKVVVGK